MRPQSRDAAEGKWNTPLKKVQAAAAGEPRERPEEECGYPLRAEIGLWRRASKETQASGASVLQLQGLLSAELSFEAGHPAGT